MRIDNIVVNRNLLFNASWPELFYKPEENDMRVIDLSLSRPHVN